MKGFLAGKQFQPRDLAALCYAHGWTEAINLVTVVAVCLSESQGYQRAQNDNKLAISDCKAGQVVRNVETEEPYTVVDPAKGVLQYADGTTDTFPPEVEVVTSRDVGLFQINIPAEKIFSAEETRLFDDVDYNIDRARDLFDARGFQPWYGYTKNVYTRDNYIRRASRGVGNFLADELLRRPTDMLSGQPYEHTITTPVLHYQHSVEVLDGAASQAITRLHELRPLLTSETNQVRVDAIAKTLAAARTEAKK